MKKALVTLFIFSFFLIPSAQAARPVIRIVDKPHTNFDGTFRDNELAVSLLPNGKLGKLIFGAILTQSTFVLDAALIDEVQQMTGGYSFKGKEDLSGQKTAQNWLFRLKNAVTYNTVVALPYGNPDEKLLTSLAHSELNFYSHFAQARLATILGHTVVSEHGWGEGTSRFSGQFHNDYLDNRRLIFGLTTITSSTEVENLRARLAIIFNPLLNSKDRAYFSYNENIAVEAISNRFKVIPGRYQITSHSAKLPVTLVNNFDTASVVSVSLTAMNSRIQVGDIKAITVAAKSRQQVLVPVTVIAPGNTVVLAQFMNTKGQLVGNISNLNISSTIIDSRVAWFTTGAAVLLFLGAVTQSVRRVRRSRS
jgi:hypothetical protein